MRCSRCEFENPAGMRFCGQCAAPLAAVCPGCGAVNPPGNRFCGQCAAPLVSDGGTTVASPDTYTPRHLAEKILTSRAAFEGERKQVTVLFGKLYQNTGRGELSREHLATATTMFREMDMRLWLSHT
jgi:double zinc ribbon protein